MKKKTTSIKDRGPGSIAYLFPNDQYSGQIRMNTYGKTRLVFENRRN